jgi:hypothetical protein
VGPGAGRAAGRILGRHLAPVHLPQIGGVGTAPLGDAFLGPHQRLGWLAGGQLDQRGDVDGGPTFLTCGEPLSHT